MLGRLTGVGQYGLRLLEALARLPAGAGVEELGVFNGRDVVTLGSFLDAVRQRPNAARHERLKRIIRMRWPALPRLGRPLASHSSGEPDPRRRVELVP